MWSIFSYVYFPSVYLLWWGVCLGLWPIFSSGCLFSYCWVLRVLCIFWITILYQIYFLQIFPSSFHSHDRSFTEPLPFLRALPITTRVRLEIDFSAPIKPQGDFSISWWLDYNHMILWTNWTLCCFRLLFEVICNIAQDINNNIHLKTENILLWT